MNLDRVEALLRLLQRQDYVDGMTVSGDGWRVSARRVPGMPPLPPIEAPPDEAPPLPERVVVRAGLVGVYLSPDRPLQAGAFVARGSTAGNIDSLRVLSPVTVEEDGYVTDVLVEDGEAVEYGQELFVLSPEPVQAEAPG